VGLPGRGESFKTEYPVGRGKRKHWGKMGVPKNKRRCASGSMGSNEDLGLGSLGGARESGISKKKRVRRTKREQKLGF